MPYLNLSAKTTADETLLRKVLNELCNSQEKEISVTLCTAQEIQALNKKYRRQNKPTDVLSFESGDIIIAPAVAKINAKKYHNSLDAELIYLMIHGLCHLRGHDHAGDQDTEKMRRAENKLLACVRKKYNIAVRGRI